MTLLHLYSNILLFIDLEILRPSLLEYYRIETKRILDEIPQYYEHIPNRNTESRIEIRRLTNKLLLLRAIYEQTIKDFLKNGRTFLDTKENIHRMLAILTDLANELIEIIMRGTRGTDIDASTSSSSTSSTSTSSSN